MTPSFSPLIRASLIVAIAVSASACATARSKRVEVDGLGRTIYEAT